MSPLVRALFDRPTGNLHCVVCCPATTKAATSPVPRHMRAALPVIIRGARVPRAEADGHHCLRFPVGTSDPR